MSNFYNEIADLRSSNTPLSDVIESFQRSNHQLKPLTMRCYLGALRRFDAHCGNTSGPAIDHATLADLSADNANAYIASVADHRYMARADAAVLKVFAKWCVKANLLADDPLAGVKTPRVPKWRPKPYDAPLVRPIIEAAGESMMGPRDRAIVLLSIVIAGRPNEVRQLRWPDDVDLERGLVRIREETSKTPAGHREIPLDPQAIAVLDEYVKDYRPRGAGPLFLNARNKGFTYYGFMAVHARLKERLRRKGITGYQAYRNRHTGLTAMAKVYNAFDVQRLAGHEDISTTRMYVGASSMAELKRLPSAFTASFGRVV